MTRAHSVVMLLLIVGVITCVILLCGRAALRVLQGEDRIAPEFDRTKVWLFARHTFLRRVEAWLLLAIAIQTAILWLLST